MLVVLRFLFGAALLYAMKKAWQNGETNLQAGDLLNAGLVATCVILAVANALVWAPYFGEKVSGPMTGVITSGDFVERKNHLLRLVYWFQDRGYRRCTAFFCFLEGVHYPDRPTAFVIGLKHSQPGSWLEKVYAKELFRFDNAQNCVLAYQALRRQNLDPGAHRNPEINRVLMTLNRSAKPEPQKLPVPSAPPPAMLKRNSRISLFSGADQPQPAEANTAEARAASDRAVE